MEGCVVEDCLLAEGKVIFAVVSRPVGCNGSRNSAEFRTIRSGLVGDGGSLSKVLKTLCAFNRTEGKKGATEGR